HRTCWVPAAPRAAAPTPHESGQRCHTPQTVCLAQDLPARLATVLATLRSRSRIWPHPACWQRNTRSASARSVSYQPPAEQVVLVGWGREASTTGLPYQAAW